MEECENPHDERDGSRRDGGELCAKRNEECKKGGRHVDRRCEGEGMEIGCGDGV